MEILRITLYALLPLFVIGNLFRIQVQENVFINLLDAAVVLILPLSIFYISQGSQKLRQHQLTKYVSVFVAACALSLMVASFSLKPSDTLIAFAYLLRLIAYTQLIFLPTLLGKKFTRRYLKLLFASITTSAVLGLGQYVFYKDLRNLIYLGWDEHLHRLFSTFFDPNFAGVIFALGISLGMYIVQDTTNKKNKLSIVSQIVLALSLILTYSRTAYISFASAAVLYISKFVGKKFLLLFFGLVIVAYILLPKDLFGEGVNLTRTASVFARANEMEKGIYVFQKSPVTGIGFNAYGAHTTSESIYPNNASRGIPNSYIFTLATTGIVGVFALAYFIYGIYKLYNNTSKKVLKQLLFSTSLILLLSALFENTLFYNFNLFLYFSILGSVAALQGE